MKDVYVIKVKTKPPLSSLYPSERRYSASTVGGLSLVHLGLSVLSFLLGTLARSLQGPVLSFACLVPFVSGLLAWRRWYIDKNISFFFYGSLFSLIVSILCGVATVFDVAAITEGGFSPAWKLQSIFDYPERFHTDKQYLRIIERNETGEDFHGASEKDDESNRDINCNDTFSENKEIINCTKEILGEKLSPVNIDHVSSSSSVRYFPGLSNGLFSFWGGDSHENRRTNLLLDINVLVTCILEICWSLLSVKISLRGMRNRMADNNSDNNNGVFPVAQRVKPRAPNPSAIANQVYDHNNSHDDIINEENFRNFAGYRRNSLTENSAPRLPLPESKKEFRERVERFLAHQAAHRIVEGSCS